MHPSDGEIRYGTKGRQAPRCAMLEAALDLLGQGFWPVLIHPYDAPVVNPGKQPIGEAWGKTRPTVESLTAAFARCPNAGIGIKLGADTGVIDIEIDDPERGEATLLAMMGGEEIATRGWRSARGTHRLFAWDARLAKYRKSILKIDGVEIRIGALSASDKQFQSIVPPSLGGDGQPRTWNEHPEIAALPDAFFAFLDAHTEPPKVRVQKTPLVYPTGHGPTRYVARAFQDEIEKLERATEGDRNNQLNRSAFALGQLIDSGFIDETHVYDALLDRAIRLGLGEHESRATIRSGIAAGRRTPRDLSGVGQNGLVLRPRLGTASPAGRPHTNGSHHGPGLPPGDGGGNGDDRDGNHDEPEGPGVAERVNDPHRLARMFLARRHAHAHGPRLRFWSEQFHVWDGLAWRVHPDHEAKAEVSAVIKDEFDRVAREVGQTVLPVTTSLLNNVMSALRDLCLLPSQRVVSQPCWIGAREPGEDLPPPDELLPASNALVHLSSYIAGEPYLLPLTPRFFSPNNLRYPFQGDAPEPAEWLRFLRSLWPDDPESIQALQEWLGYLLVSDTSQQKILMLIGPKRSGKGTIARTIRALVGPENVTAPTLSGLSTNFGLAPLIGKTVAIIADARLSGRVDQAVIVERLLSISGEDAQTIDRKHLSCWTGTLPCRFVLISNELPRLQDASGALPGRMIVLRLTRSFFGHEDTGLQARILAELSGILLWAIDGWARFRTRGRFFQPESGKELLDELEDLASPVASFVADCCELGPDLSVGVQELYDAWKQFCKERGREHAGDVSGFSRNLRALLPQLKTRQVRRNGRRVRELQGIELNVVAPF